MPFTPIMAFGAGISSAVAVFSIVFGSILALPLFYLAPLPLYLAGLGIGGKGILIAVLAAVFTVGLIGGAYTALPFALAYGMPALLVCRQALQKTPGPDGIPVWRPAGEIAATLSVLGAVFLFFAAFTAMMDETVTSLPEMVGGFLGQALDRMAANLTSDVRETFVSSLVPFFPGMAVAGWVIMHAMNAAAGQIALVKSGRNVRSKTAFIDLTLPDWFNWVLVGAGIMALVLPGDWSYLGRNLVIVALVPFLLVGLAVVHTFARRLTGGTLLLVAFYFILVVFGWAAFLVAGAGVIEQWVGLRKRMQAATDQESE